MVRLIAGEPAADREPDTSTGARTQAHAGLWARHLSSRAKWILALVTVPLAWPVYSIAPGYGLGHSWSAGLSLALQHGLRFGHDVVYTYGPLGFMSPPTMWWRPTAIVGVLLAALVTCLLARLVLEGASRVVPLLPTLIVTYVVMRVAAVVEPAETLGILICLAALLAIQRGASGRWATMLPSLFAAAAAVALLTKFDAGVQAALAALVASWWLGARRWRSLAQFAGSLVAALIVLWVSLGQQLTDLPTWLQRSWEIAQGYSVAMAAYLPTHTPQLIMVFFFLPTIVLAAKWTHGRRMWAVWAVVAVLVFFQVKHGTIRYQVGGPYLAGVALPVVMAWQRKARVITLALPAVFAGYLLTLAPPVHLFQLSLSPVSTTKKFFTQAGDLLSSSRAARLQSTARTALRDELQISPRVLSALQGHRVFVDPYEVSAAWAYGLRWQPVPVFQRFSAYTPSLDLANASFLTSPEGPDVVLSQRYRRAIDHRNLLWDSPAMERALACNFQTTVQDRRWRVWSRVPSRCGPAQLIGQATGQPGEPIAVPAVSRRGTILFARVTMPTSFGARLQDILYKPFCPAQVADGTSKYRLVPATAMDGLILAAPPDAPFGAVLPPQSLTFHCLPGSPVHIAFYSMRYDAPSTNVE